MRIKYWKNAAEFQKPGCCGFFYVFYSSDILGIFEDFWKFWKLLAKLVWSFIAESYQHYKLFTFYNWDKVVIFVEYLYCFYAWGKQRNFQKRKTLCTRKKEEKTYAPEENDNCVWSWEENCVEAGEENFLFCRGGTLTSNMISMWLISSE